MSRPLFFRVWGGPLLLGIAVVVGSISALMSEQLWASILSWIGLGLPLVVILRYWPFRRWFEVDAG
jgi:hypothetical protein